MNKAKSLKELRVNIDKFNAMYKIGDRVLVNVSGESKFCTVKYQASLLGNHTAVGWFNEMNSCYDLNKVESLK